MSEFQPSFESIAHYEKLQGQLIDEKGFNLIMTYGGGSHWEGEQYLPHQLWDLLLCSPMREDAYHYWWRAISATYLVRPNERTLQKLFSFQQQPDQLKVYTNQILPDNVNSSVLSVVNPSPTSEDHISTSNTSDSPDSPARPSTTATTNTNDLSSSKEEGDNNRIVENITGGEDCIALFVRHGDKGIEMHLHSVEEYLNIATMMWKFGLVPTAYQYYKHHFHSLSKEEKEKFDTNSTSTTGRSSKETILDAVMLHQLPPISFNGTLFIGSEDQTVLEDTIKWGKEAHWNVVYTNLFDRTIQSAAKTWDEVHQKHHHTVHDPNEYLSMLWNLYYSIQCEAWVCTLASNSCRIIDELRTTIGAKANRFFADISAETCDIPPCINDLFQGRIIAFGE